METKDGPKSRGGAKGIDWSGPQRDYVENGDDTATIAERYGCSVQMVRAKRRELRWDDLRAAKVAKDRESAAASSAKADDATSAKVQKASKPSTRTALSTETAVRVRTEEQLERQEAAFGYSIAGLTIREIATELKVCTNTVLEDLAHEQQRRADLIGERQRKVELVKAAAVYERVIAKAFNKSDLNDKLLQNIIAGADGKVSDRSLDSVIKARERLDKIFTVEPITRHKTREARAKAEIAKVEAGQAAQPDAFGDDTRWEVEYHIVPAAAEAS
jgi:hypothetical protein